MNIVQLSSYALTPTNSLASLLGSPFRITGEFVRIGVQLCENNIIIENRIMPLKSCRAYSSLLLTPTTVSSMVPHSMDPPASWMGTEMCP